MEPNVSPDLVANYRRLRKDGALNEALRLARKGVSTVEPGQVAQLGKLLQKDLPGSAGDTPVVEVLLLGQCTTTYLPPVVTAWAWSEGLRVSVKDGEYDQVLQELMQLTPDQAPAVIVVLPWNQRLLGVGDRGVAERVDDELAFLGQVWAQVVRLKVKLVQVSYDWVHPGPLATVFPHDVVVRWSWCSVSMQIFGRRFLRVRTMWISKASAPGVARRSFMTSATTTGSSNLSRPRDCRWWAVIWPLECVR
ncbi:hypothetical protein [Verrucomicrobium spinosum]|uniref:hypothetical protein n=1 Tax=Verrucomicrobium spinosum TaxID=2736 RepID=UPI000946209F|nr:hypothetical protein [Verrucomicrobium spinosum]